MMVEYIRGEREFVVLCWVATRLLILIAFGAVAPAMQSTQAAPPDVGLLNRLAFFDGAWYLGIAGKGYEYAPDSAQHSVAFFPLYPALIGLLVRADMPSIVAGLAVNNVAFFMMLFVAYDWARERSGVLAGRWMVATLCLAPMSIFGSTVYSEGVFMLTLTLALISFDREKYLLSATFAAACSLTRFPGIALSPAFLITTLVAKRRSIAWICVVAPLLGVLIFGTFCEIKFADPLAFIHSQTAWRPHFGFDAGAWSNLVGAGLSGSPWLQVSALCLGTCLWVGRRRFNFATRVALSFSCIEAERWAWNGSEYIFLFTVVAAIAIFIFRSQIGSAGAVFAACSIALVFSAGYPISVDRLGYAVLPSVFALSLLWRRFPSVGFASLAVMAIDLALFSLKFARAIFIA